MFLIFPPCNDVAQAAVVRKLTHSKSSLCPAAVTDMYYYAPTHRIFFINIEIKLHA